MQGLLVGVSFAIGYGIGVIISYIFHKLPIKQPSSELRQKLKLWAYVVLGAFFISSMVIGSADQKEVHNLVKMEGDPNISILGTLIVAVLITLLLITMSRAIRTMFRWLLKQIDKLLPRSVSYVLAFVASFLIVVGIINGFIIDNVMEGINTAYIARNDITDEGIVKPENPELSGSPQSFIPWDTLGKQGRKFIGTAVKPADIQEFTGAPAKSPVRIYSGLESEDTAESRSNLAVDDLKRAGGFDRQILVVVTTTGTGWVNETSADTIEYMYGGDSATISMQYSYLPSWISFLVDKQKARDAGVALYNAVYDEWRSLPEAKRPRLVSYGESLGSFGAEAAFPTPPSFKATSQGILLVGPPSSNSIHSEVADARDPGTPQVLPVVNTGETVRFAAVTPDLAKPTAKWNFPRAVYLQHGSDPIVWWSPSLFLSKPDWLKEARASDVSSKTQWIPIVTFFQVSADMAYGTAVPDGYGHNYGTLPTDAWGYVAPPEGWTQEKTEALKKVLANQD